MEKIRNRNKNVNNKFMTTNCTKAGIKITDSGNDYKRNPFEEFELDHYSALAPKSVSASASLYENMDLNLNNYSREDLYNIFGLKKTDILTEDIMKQSKKIVLKTHPDVSRLEKKYFIFFTASYKKLYEIYQFQNKVNSKKAIEKTDYFDSQNGVMLDKIFDEEKELKNPKKFNQWFNEKFEKYRVDDPVEHGYGNWLESDQDIIYTPQNVSKSNMGKEMNSVKKNLQQLTPYSGVGNSFLSSSAGGTALMDYNNNNFSSGALFTSDGGGVGYTDLKQAYIESVIPITEEDFYKIKKYNSVGEYKNQRDQTNLTPLSKAESMKLLYNQEKELNEESAALAFYYAQQTEKAMHNNSQFWSGLKQITN